jgi:hypothetical protein
MLLAVLSCALVAGCGGGGAGGPSASPVPTATDRQDQPEPAADGRGEPQVDAQVVPPARVVAIGRRLDALLAAYAPVTARVNYLVSAETLRQDAIDSRAGQVIELERTGAVRLELRRMRALLQRTRPRLLDVQVDDEAQQQVRQSMQRAIDARLRAIEQLELALEGRAAEVGATIVDQHFAAWRDAWGESVRAAREATTAMQVERARVGLEPGPEDSIR